MVPALKPERLRTICDPKTLGFETTADIEPLTEFVDQEIAVRAIQTALTQQADGHHLAVVSPQGVSRTSVLLNRIREIARGRHAHFTPEDLCLVFNVNDPRKPLWMRLPAGRGRALSRALDECLEGILKNLPERIARVDIALQGEYQSLVQELTGALETQYRAMGVAIHVRLVQQGVAISFVDTADSSRNLNPEEWIAAARDASEQEIRRAVSERIDHDGAELVKAIQKRGRNFRAMAIRRKKQAVRNLLFGYFGPRFRDFPEARSYLTSLKDFVTQNIEAIAFFAGQGGSEPPRELALPFQINIVVDNAQAEYGPPVITEPNMTFARVFGEISGEHRGNMLITDHTKITGGAILEANGGVLVLDALELFSHPFLWPKLVATLEAGELKIGDFPQYAGMPISFPLELAPVPVTTKVVLVFPEWLYYDALRVPPIGDKIRKIFRVKAEFVSKTKRTREVERQYGGFLAMCAEREDLLPFTAAAVAKVVEYGSRLADHQCELSLRFSDIKSLALEADQIARMRNVVAADMAHMLPIAVGDVEQAINEKHLRVSRIKDAIHEEFRKGTLLFDPTKPRVAKVYGLSVLSTGEVRFGIPSPITALNWAKPDGGVVSVDRKSELGGPILGKATDIIAGWIMARYAQKKPFPRGVTIVFEQQYGGVEGDSATIAEVCAVLSSLSELPIRQNIAVTGSMNQLGDIQPIGGANEKIEGFFDVCAVTHGTEGKGVVLPASNVQHLMLREDVVSACAAGTFHVFAVSRIEEAVEVLFGVPMETIDQRIRENFARHQRRGFWATLWRRNR